MRLPANIAFSAMWPKKHCSGEAWLEKNVPDLVKNTRQEISMRFARSEDVEFFLGSLRKAGLAFKDLTHLRWPSGFYP